MKDPLYLVLDFENGINIFESRKVRNNVEDGIDILKELVGQQDFKVYSVLMDYRMNPLSASTNLPTKTHPFQAKWAKFTGNEMKVSLHAEIRSLIYNEYKGEEHTILVMRLDKRGRLNLARPCDVCSAALYYDSSVSNVIYTNERQQFILEPIDNFKPRR